MSLPAPRTADPQDAPAIRWGILAPGGIARTFARAVAVGTGSSVVAVGSRSTERAQAFADDHGIARVHGSYEDLVADEQVDAVYIASPHSAHHEHALLCLRAGKPVLVEKAFTRNVPEASEVLEVAREGGLLVAEAMWSRYLPHYDVVRHAVETGLLGDLVQVSADHGQLLHPDGPARLAQPELAGGALLDLGVYPISFADMVLAAAGAGGVSAESVSATATLTDLGVDAHTTVVVASDAGARGVLTSTMSAATPCVAVVSGTRARLELDRTFYNPTIVRLVASDGTVVDEFDGEFDKARGFSYEAAEFARALTAGESETASMPHAATMRVMATMDEVRRQVGVSYPGE